MPAQSIGKVQAPERSSGRGRTLSVETVSFEESTVMIIGRGRAPAAQFHASPVHFRVA